MLSSKEYSKKCNKFLFLYFRDMFLNFESNEVSPYYCKYNNKF